MIRSKTFKSEKELSDFIGSRDFQYNTIISIETLRSKYNTGLPLLNGETYYVEEDIIKLWYK